MAKTSKTYVCATGMDSGAKRMERGATYIGANKSVSWLVEQGHLVEAGSDAANAIAAELAAAAETETEG